ncbi:hypothetical protein [Tenacibaculum maritimum]|uniref:hypothetical protein n=1 Tax=Tenacibaculum maritimum TaxID=107401 RepID=UPI00388CF3B5
MIPIKYTYLLLLSLFVLSPSTSEMAIGLTERISLVSSAKEYVAGNTIILEFSGTQDTSIRLYCTNSYGSTILSSEVKNNRLFFFFPDYMSDKASVINWKLLATGKNALSGKFTIIPQPKPTTMETYLGPPSIVAGGRDFSMLVVIPTDALDNPIKEKTKVVIQNQFNKAKKRKGTFTKNLISHTKIYSPKKSGRMLISSTCLGLDSKEYSLNVMPSTSLNFKIFAQRHHKYADGNQITTFTTSILKDANNNIVSDGTFVEFFITNKKGNILKAMTATINGVATARMIHPDYEEEWRIKAYVIGIAESNTLFLKYQKAVTTFNVTFSHENRTIEVGPLKSFMDQIIPDGLQVKLAVYQNGTLQREMVKESRDGYVKFTLNPNIFSDGMYGIEITTAGITRKFQTKKLW